MGRTKPMLLMQRNATRRERFSILCLQKQYIPTVRGDEEKCTAKPGNSDSSCVAACNSGDTGCLCTVGETQQKCGANTTCSNETVTDALTGDPLVCVKTCADGESNCMCGSTVCNGTTFCESSLCVSGCTDGAAAEQSCTCGIDSDGAKVECAQGQVCSTSVSTESGPVAMCATTAPTICGTTDNNITIDNYKSLFGLVAHVERGGAQTPCICSLDKDNTKTMCSVGTYCSYQTETCLPSIITACDKVTVLDAPCFCNNQSSPNTFHDLPLGICSRGDMCVHPELRRCAYPVARCRPGLLEECFCNSGERQTYCSEGEECVVDPDQTSPETTQACKDDSSSCSLSLSHYGKCVAK